MGLMFNTLLILGCAKHADALTLPDRVEWSKTIVDFPDDRTGGPLPSEKEARANRTITISQLSPELRFAVIPAMAADLVAPHAPEFEAERNYMWSVSGVVADAMCCPDFIEKWHEDDRGSGFLGPRRHGIQYLQIRFRESQEDRARRERLAELEKPPEPPKPGGSLSEYDAEIAAARETALAANKDEGKRHAAVKGGITREFRAAVWALDEKYGRPRTRFGTGLL